MTLYRLEAERAGAGPHLFPRTFPTVEAACDYAERVIDRLAVHPGWRVRGFRVRTLDMGRVVTTVPWHDPESDPDPFAPTMGPTPGQPPLPGVDTPVPASSASGAPQPAAERHFAEAPPPAGDQS